MVEICISTNTFLDYILGLTKSANLMSGVMNACT